MCAFNLLYSFIGTILQKTRELFNISTTDECRLWCCNFKKDSSCYNTLSDLEETVAGVCSSEKEDMYFMLESALNLVYLLYNQIALYSTFVLISHLY